MNTMMELRKCCNHPFLITGAEEQIVAEYREQHPDLRGDEEAIVMDALVQSSGKLVLIDKLLPRLKSTGHKVLIFSQMVRCLDILEEYLLHTKYDFFMFVFCKLYLDYSCKLFCIKHKFEPCISYISKIYYINSVIIVDCSSIDLCIINVNE